MQDFKSVNFPPEIADFPVLTLTNRQCRNDNVLFSVIVEDPDSNYADVLIRVESDIDGIFPQAFRMPQDSSIKAYDGLLPRQPHP